MTGTDIDTEILTKHGWKRYDELDCSDFVLSFRPDENDGLWVPIDSISSTMYHGSMMEIQCESLKICLTPESSLLCKVRLSPGFSAWKLIGISNMGKRQVCVKSSTTSSCTQTNISNNQIALAGWAMTDGCFTCNRNSPSWTIYQSKDTYEIERLLLENDLTYSKRTRQRNTKYVCGKHLIKLPKPENTFRISAESTRKVLTWIPPNIKNTLPKWCYDMSDQQFDVFLDALISGDGSRYCGKTCTILYGKKQLLDNVQALAVRHGWRALMSVAREKDFRLNISKNDCVEFKPHDVITTKTYSGPIWSLTTKYKNALVRRFGSIHFMSMS